MSLIKRASKHAEEILVVVDNKKIYTCLVVEFFKKEKSKEQIEEFKMKIWISVYKIFLLEGWINYVKGFHSIVNLFLYKLNYDFEELLKSDEELRNLDDIRLKILKDIWEQLDEDIKEFGVDSYKGSCSLEHGSENLLINFFIEDVTYTTPFFAAKEEYYKFNKRAMRKAATELKNEGLVVYKGYKSKDSKRYNYLTAMENVLIEEAPEILKVEKF